MLTKIHLEYTEKIEQYQADFDDVVKCKLCFDHVADVVLGACGHRVCTECRLQLDVSGNSTCPWDRSALKCTNI